MDVFRANGSEWFVSSGGREPFESLQLSVFRAGDLLIADFDGDDQADVLRQGTSR